MHQIIMKQACASTATLCSLGEMRPKTDGWVHVHNMTHDAAVF